MIKLTPAIKKEAKQIAKEMRRLLKTMQDLDGTLEDKRIELWECIAQDPAIDMTANVYNYNAINDEVTLVTELES
jgi:hypothetical protein